MDFPIPSADYIRQHLEKLSENQRPEWGSMSAQRMVEHLEDTIEISIGTIEAKLEIKEEHVPGALKFLASDKPMPRGYKVGFASGEIQLRANSLNDAIDSIVERWKVYESTYMENTEHTTMHPVYGMCDKSLWDRIHAKHFVHHFEQFNL